MRALHLLISGLGLFCSSAQAALDHSQTSPVPSLSISYPRLSDQIGVKPGRQLFWQQFDLNGSGAVFVQPGANITGGSAGAGIRNISGELKLKGGGDVVLVRSGHISIAASSVLGTAPITIVPLPAPFVLFGVGALGLAINSKRTAAKF
ncbi:hypothetical protein PL263_15995 [Methylomonas sp. EFPC3]|uniref:hypothetical protein n=1 Tax=Methylomonas sp. EFPC3 TaxID=3021710 RepID=UPI002417FDB0|nr:hypothetical protein [Methylomonas sp. EFPC3]WFP49589.1 hypothetical protein PL263_15995 [Methylomonas sp. EFPC3]